ncbi:succinate dehydrogenase/fumarate reductase cytochrome b subunit [Constrictibacter sp. MBR-5]|jgi:hypothetical protein|uniref:hypothetical protein n=1 Tax=Constrictibacter sp. MBR-5 TaxID=3156467 RepID=UPI0033984A4F
MQVMSGLFLICVSFGLLVWGAVTMRSAGGSDWARKPFAAEMLAIFLIAMFAAGAGVLIDFVTGLPRATAYAWAGGLVVGIPLVLVVAWRVAGVSDRMARPALPGGVAPPANDARAPRGASARKRAA